MHLNQRQQAILEQLLTQESATVSELSQLFDVSPVTIRSDLGLLADQGRVMRTHGGARIVPGRTRQELTFATRQEINLERKRRIGEVAASLIEPVESILLDASTTAVSVAQAIKRREDLRDVTVVTTGIWTALEVLGALDVNVVLTGGAVRNTTGSITGSITEQALAQFNFHKVFLGAWGVTLEEGLTDTHLAEVELKRAIIERAQSVICILDGSKFGRLGLTSFASVEEIDHLITDDSAPGEMINALRAQGVEVHVA
jgi:DeoR/GlpR family transcriptional regulator of sugar metabolism